MAQILERILAAKRGEVEIARRAVPLEEMRRRAARAPAPRGFERALRERIAAGTPAVIAEIKRSSPSRGLIRADFDPARIAAAYQANGAACLSVLTDHEFFGGSLADLEQARASCALPVLRKDFIVDEYQVHEARASGADCILLIMDAASDAELVRLERAAHALGMDVLVESHDERQLLRALHLATPLIGINNRDLRSFQTNLETTLGLAGRVPAGRIVVSESGIAEPADVARLSAANVSAYLVGSAFMAAEDPGNELRRVFFES
jgi:indole-3-glycerol phosphate synthase